MWHQANLVKGMFLTTSNHSHSFPKFFVQIPFVTKCAVTLSSRQWCTGMWCFRSGFLARISWELECSWFCFLLAVATNIELSMSITVLQVLNHSHVDAATGLLRGVLSLSVDEAWGDFSCLDRCSVTESKFDSPSIFWVTLSHCSRWCFTFHQA